MRRTLRVLGLVGVAAAAATAAAKHVLHGSRPAAEQPSTVSHELRQALTRFENRFGT